MEKTCTDLLQLQEIIAQGIDSVLPASLWVKAEISSLSYHRNGHCYLDLSQNRDGIVVAQVKAVIWASAYRQISACFASATGVPLRVGHQVLVFCKVQYNPRYGLSLVISDIDPSFTIGEREMLRNRTLARLEKEGLTQKQRELGLCSLPYRLAVISAASAAGYRDFVRHLNENADGFRFSVTLYPSPMQGEECAAGVAAALNGIELSGISYDAVLILRGGGSELDLSCYDDYSMCAAIAAHPFPVFTAIGHDKDVHLCDMVAFEALKTPTALADRMLEPYFDEDARLWDLKERLKNVHRTRLDALERHLDLLRTRLDAANPRKLLSRGYAFVLDEKGRAIGGVQEIYAGETVTVMMADGGIECTVKKVNIL